MENSQPETKEPEQKIEIRKDEEQKTPCLLIPVGVPIPKIVKTEVELSFTETTVYSEEYKELLEQIDMMFAYIGRRLAEIPELKESGAKRAMTYHTMVKCLAINCQITESQVIAALDRAKFQLMYATETERATKEYQKQLALEAVQKTSAYTQ